MAKIASNMLIPVKPIIIGNLYSSNDNPELVLKAIGAGQKPNQFTGVVVKTNGENENYVVGYQCDCWYNNNFNDYVENIEEEFTIRELTIEDLNEII
jgi:hypothetical protein